MFGVDDHTRDVVGIPAGSGEALYPWFWRDGELAGDRVNDLHLTAREKQGAREHVGDVARNR